MRRRLGLSPGSGWCSVRTPLRRLLLVVLGVLLLLGYHVLGPAVPGPVASAASPDQKPWVVIEPRSLDGEQGLPRDVGALDFANQPVNVESPVQLLAISNRGSDDLTITDITPISGPFKVTNREDCTQYPIAVGGDCFLKVTFMPTQEGPVHGELSITDNSPDQSPEYVSLDGTGTDNIARPPASVAESEGTPVDKPKSRDEPVIEHRCKGLANTIGWKLLDDPQPQPLIGEVVQGHVASEDASPNHHNSDYNFFVYPDYPLGHPEYRRLLASPGNWHTGDPYEKGRIEVEWEKQSARWPGGFPSWAWPTQGDRVQMVGNHVLDCGHEDQGHYRSEIHPPRFVVTYRNAALSRLAETDYFDIDDPLGELSGRRGGFAPDTHAAATRVDVFASSYGGLAIRSEEGVGAGWFQPVNRNYTFTIMAPPKPLPDAVLALHQDPPRIRENVGNRDVKCDPRPTGDGYDCTLPLAKVPTTTDKPMVFGEELSASWMRPPDTPKLQIDHYLVKLESIHIRKALTGQWSLSGYVNDNAQDDLLQAGTKLAHGSHVGGDHPVGELAGGLSATDERYADVHDGATIRFANPPMFEVDVVQGQALRVAFRASTWTTLGGPGSSDFMGTAELIRLNTEHVLTNPVTGQGQKIDSSAHLAVGFENDTDKACHRPCFSVTVQIAKQPS